jgi:hypothetical protein
VTAAAAGATCLMHMGPSVLPAANSFPAIQSHAARFAGAQTPRASEHRTHASVPMCGLPNVAAASARSSRGRFATRTHRLRKEFQVERYAAFLRLASSRESTSATIPSITV